MHVTIWGWRGPKTAGVDVKGKSVSQTPIK